MLIPSIDLQGGRVVQLVQGERLAIASDDVQEWIDRFRGWPIVQVIDLDAAKGQGHNAEIVARICAALPCNVGGGIRSIDRAREMLDLGARRAIAGSALFKDSVVDVEFAQGLAAEIGPDRLVAAVDSKGGYVVTHGWRKQLTITAVDAVRALEPFVGTFLYTHVDREGLMEGADMPAIERVNRATLRHVIAAGGITTMEEVNYLDAIGVDAVVGMALYTGRIALPNPPRSHS
jgi:phosphoribosylformimino-5-aminoimidazole carboxamide ribotide isomerase